ncbi:SDR family NAD(P)-dependent oxidoreductase [Pseudobacillus wudalianchiensis]|uniref:Short-chain dehydrogenase n=1 Tax=Pseudobacillus wudalianchiensis TaxID=1743143 RepID=A0A1B9B7E6_9BACI|nr:glucose 1-dehydrogenase [Bacillus wudalianchiensis]OCA92016.1 short-chain dehydrogenase [Bacillus wudalianchiensis]
MGRLNGKVAIITGAASGQGAAEAEIFAKEGAKVVAVDVQMDLLEQVVLNIRESRGEAFSMKLDVSSEEDWKTVIEQTIDIYGKVDILVNNAGVIISNNIEKCTLEEWNKIQNINSTGVYLGMKYVIAEMLKTGGGSIVNISSIDSIVGGSSSAAYVASKGSVRSLSRHTAIDYAKSNIRVNTVFPGYIITPMTAEQLTDEERSEYIYSQTALPYLGNPEDVAYGVLYLASDEAKFVTGTELVIDGGYTAK